MGWSLSWLGFRDVPRDRILGLLNLHSTGKHDSVTHGKIGYLELPKGWKLVLFDHKEFRDKELTLLSQRDEFVYCFIEEHVMFSKAALWKASTEVWSVAHSGEIGALDLKADGALPPRFESIRVALMEKQQKAEESSVDHFFEIPVLLAEETTGFRYDKEILGVWEDETEILEPVKQASGWKRLFGAK